MILSVIVPIYKDSYFAEELCTRLAESALAHRLSQLGVNKTEVIFVADGQIADYKSLKALSAKFPSVNTILLSRNFGQHIAITCGLAHSSGDYVSFMDVDMEDPPESLPTLIETLQQGPHDIVVGLRASGTTGHSWFKKLSSRSFHYVLGRLTGFKLPLNCATMRVMTRQFAQAYEKFNESQRYLPGLESWLGFSRTFVEIKQVPRAGKGSSYSFKKRLKFAFSTILSFSDLPLKLMLGVGLAFAGVGFLMIALLILSKLFMVDYLPGFTATISLITFFGGVQIMMLGIVGLYVGRILIESQRRPLYIIRDSTNEKWKNADNT